MVRTGTVIRCRSFVLSHGLVPILVRRVLDDFRPSVSKEDSVRTSRHVPFLTLTAREEVVNG